MEAVVVIYIEPRDNQTPLISVHQALDVDEGGCEILSPDMLSVKDNDTPLNNLTVILVSAPLYGYLQLRHQRHPSVTMKVEVGSTFSLDALLKEQLSYVQSEHDSIEPRHDSFQFCVSDSFNQSPVAEMTIAIENINDEPPWVVSNAVTMGRQQTFTTLTSGSLQVQDPDTDPSHIAIKVIKEPANGRLRKFDHVTNGDQILGTGDVFYYQDVLQGDVSFHCSSTKDQELQLQVSDGDFDEDTTLRFKRQTGVTGVSDDDAVNDAELQTVATDACVVQFRDTLHVVQEDSNVTHIDIVRSGDLLLTCSVICSTQADTARDGPRGSADFDGRGAASESSRVFFLRGVTSVACPITIHDDAFYEGDETFLLRLSRPQIEQVDAAASTPGAAGASVGSRNLLVARIVDAEDATRLQFNQTTYRPSVFTLDVVNIPVQRTGDLSVESRLSVGSRDGSAKEAQDFLLETRQLVFSAGQSLAWIGITFLTRPMWTKSFSVVLKVDELSIARLGSIASATVFIPPTASPRPVILPAQPIVVSLMHYDSGGEEEEEVIPPGYPVVCVSACDPKHRRYNWTQRLCRDMGIDVSKIRFSWEISPPILDDQLGTVVQRPLSKALTIERSMADGIYRTLHESTAYSSVRERVLDAAFFGPNFRVRCLTQPVQPNGTLATPSRSLPVTIAGNRSLCPPFSPSDSSGQQPFKAFLAYVNASEAEHADTMKIEVQLPHADGMVPVISTSPLHGIGYVLSDPSYRSHHRCSNLHPGVAFLMDTSNVTGGSDLPYEFSKTLRQESAVRLYSHLDSSTCLWHFKAWFTMTELVDMCGGYVASHYQASKRGQIQVTVRVPLFVTMVTAGAVMGWSCVEHGTEMEFSFSYASVLWHRGVQSQLALTVRPHVSRVRTDANGRLIIDLQTETRFAGRYLLDGTRLVAPRHLPDLGFRMQLTWSQNNDGSSLQKWTAVSNETLQDYTGDYTLFLVPCQRIDLSRLDKDDADCVPMAAVNVTLPIHYQQPLRPDPVQFSLETTFQLTNNARTFLTKPLNLEDIQDAEFEGPFHSGDRVYGRVLWHPSNDLSPGYQLRIEKLYLCAGREGFVPLFDPNAQRPRYGCLEHSHRLKYRLLLLDREDPHSSDKMVQGIALDAQFANEVDQLRSMSHVSSMDGFVFSVDPLFQLDPAVRWFLQVSYSVQPAGGTGRWRRDSDVSQVESSRRRGTNMRLLQLAWTDWNWSGRADAAPGPETTLVSSLIAAALLILLVIVVFVLLFLYFRPLNRKSRVPLPKKIVKTKNEVNITAEETTLI